MDPKREDVRTMTKRMDPEVKALYAINRALKSLDEAAQERAIDYFHARIHNTTQDRVRAAMAQYVERRPHLVAS